VVIFIGPWPDHPQTLSVMYTPENARITAQNILNATAAVDAFGGPSQELIDQNGPAPERKGGS
jgi:hypothetical protein